MLDQRASAASEGLRRIRDSLDQMEPGAELRTSVGEHYAHLIQLAENLKKLGMDEAAIDGHVIGIFERYSTQLMLSVAATCPDGASDGRQPC